MSSRPRPKATNYVADYLVYIHPTRTLTIPPKKSCTNKTRACEPRRTFRAEPGEHHRVRGADASARQHDESQLQALHTSTTGESAAQAATSHEQFKFLSTARYVTWRSPGPNGQEYSDNQKLSTSFGVIDHNDKIRDLGDHGHVHSHPKGLARRATLIHCPVL